MQRKDICRDPTQNYGYLLDDFLRRYGLTTTPLFVLGLRKKIPAKFKCRCSDRFGSFNSAAKVSSEWPLRIACRRRLRFSFTKRAVSESFFLGGKLRSLVKALGRSNDVLLSRILSWVSAVECFINYDKIDA